MDDKQLVTRAARRREGRAHARERWVLVRRFGYCFIDLVVEPLRALDEFPRRLLVDADRPLAVVEHELHQGREREPAGHLRSIGAHAVGDDNAVGLLVEAVGHGALRKARRDSRLMPSKLDDHEVIVVRRSPETRMGDGAELDQHQRRDRAEGLVATERRLRGRQVQVVVAVPIHRARAVHSECPCEAVSTSRTCTACRRPRPARADGHRCCRSAARSRCCRSAYATKAWRWSHRTPRSCRRRPPRR